MKTLTLGVGLVGYGLAGQVFHAPLINATEGMQLAAVVSSDADRVHADLPGMEVLPKAAALFDRRDIDLVVIATPNDTHYPLVKAALAAGKHVVVDKPFAVTLSEARMLRAQADNADRSLSVFHNRRWDSDFLTLKELIDAGSLGRVVSLESRFDRFRPTVTERWRDNHRPGAGIWYDLGPHLLDQVVQLFGMPRAILLELATVRDGAEVDDDFHCLLEYDGLRVSLQASSLVADPTPRFRVHGTRGSYVKFGQDPQEAHLQASLAVMPGMGVDPEPGQLSLVADEEDVPEVQQHLNLPGDYPAFYAGVVEMLLHGGPPPVSLDSALQVMELLEVGLDSYRQARWLRLKEGNSQLRQRLHRR
ncbi:oxidoreductase [Halomonas marinisediminis]|uniref:Oxidoreductase n=1 Tax=Halomonas marinisediminis TaxID=2546095 RepID=A0ABY2D9Y7_9GAMM|nr:oxidoreductase [Halomonas marinisediminis]TDB04984.1 oxidoreductase [Halomonas marinisediminis]